ncbi:MAG: DUF4350 domain-containing protein [Chloroflexi bacterium]|nr:DUF4350 domain-containing protein [Chloroflexota bacterium]
MRRNAVVLIGLFTVLLAILIAFALAQARSAPANPPYASFSTTRDGTRALFLWLQEAGYAVSNESVQTFAPPPDTSLVLTLQPTFPISNAEWDVLDAWVSAGGTLVIAGDTFIASQAFRHYSVGMRFLPEPVLAAFPQTPLMDTPPIDRPVSVQVAAALTPERDDFVTHFAVGDDPITISFEQDAGRVILSTAVFPFSNAGLQEPGNPLFVLNIVNGTRQPGTIWFNEWHHGIRIEASRTLAGPLDFLLRTPPGQAILYAAAVVFVGLLLQGRRMGRPIPPRREIVRRTPLEYITAIANLNRRAGNRRAIMVQVYQRLKSDLARRYHLSPDLPDEEFTVRVAEFNPMIDRDELNDLFRRLRQPEISEAAMVDIAQDVARWREKHGLIKEIR